MNSTSVQTAIEQAQARIGEPFQAGDRPVILNLGMGVDSTAILLRWAFEPHTRPCDWDQIIVVTAMTGNEWQQTAQGMREHILPLMQAEQIRYVQLAKAAATKTAAAERGRAGNYVVLADSTNPTALHIDGAYGLADEMLAAGTVPQIGGTRKCSIKFKGEVIDPWLADTVGGRDYVQVMGFEAGERTRALRDTKDGIRAAQRRGDRLDQRTAVYPLIEWGWSRQDCLDYIAQIAGVVWSRSACTFCPFALTNAINRAETLARFEAHPDEAILALRMEYNALALNPRQTLTSGGLDQAVSEQLWAEWMQVLHELPHTIVEVRRVYKRSDRPNQAGDYVWSWQRSTRTIASGAREQMVRALAELGPPQASRRDGTVLTVTAAGRLETGQADLIAGVEHLYALTTSGIADKQARNFETWWAARPTSSQQMAVA